MKNNLPFLNLQKTRGKGLKKTIFHTTRKKHNCFLQDPISLSPLQFHTSVCQKMPFINYPPRMELGKTIILSSLLLHMPQFSNSTADYHSHKKTPLLKFPVLLSQSSLHPQQWKNISLDAAPG